MSGGIPKPALPDPAAGRGARRNPFKLTPDPEPAAEPTPPDPAQAAAPAPTAHRGDSPPSQPRTRVARPKRPANTTDVLLSLPLDLHERLESVIAYTYPVTGVRTKQAFLRSAVERACQELEERYNGGNRWPDVPKNRR